MVAISAKEKGLPPYVIFQDPSLEEMATIYPTNKEELSQVNGVGMGKVRKFGKPFIQAIAKYVKENEIETASDVVIKSAVNKSKIKIYIMGQRNNFISNFPLIKIYLPIVLVFFFSNLRKLYPVFFEFFN